MPIYIYTDEHRHYMSFTEPMLFTGVHVCGICGAKMWRKPQAITVIWAGMKPSTGEYSPAIKRHIETLDEQRDKFIERKEIHERG